MSKPRLPPVLLAARPYEVYPCGRGCFWARDPISREIKRLSETEVSLLQALTGLQTAAEHLRLLEQRGYAEFEPGDLGSQLEALRLQGLLLDETELLAGLRTKESRRGEGPLRWAAWVTCDRPALLERGIQSWRERLGETASLPDAPAIAIFDDSNTSGTLEALHTLGGEAGPLWYAGRAEKRGLVSRLAAAGVPEDVLAFALEPSIDLGTPYGANRNALLLGTCGDVALSTDDDMVFRTARLPGSNCGASLTSQIDPAGIRYFPDRAALVEALSPAQGLAAAHLSLLGRGPEAVLGDAAASGNLEAGALGPELLRRLLTQRCRVLVTASGLHGDSGLRRNSLLSLRGESWRDVSCSEDAYAAARRSRQTVRCVEQLTIGECGYLIGQHFGLDNRTLLPPFFPVGRREDGIFALSLRLTHPEALTGHLPIAVLHDPPAPFAAAHEAEPAPQPLFADLVMLLMGSDVAPTGSKDPAARMRELGNHLCGMASLEQPELEKWVRGRWIAHWAAEIAVCEQRIQSASRRAPWVRDCEARRAQIFRHIDSGGAVCPRDLAPDGKPQAAWIAAADRLRRFGELLTWWPVIVEQTRRLREAGHGLLRPLNHRGRRSRVIQTGPKGAPRPRGLGT